MAQERRDLYLVDGSGYIFRAFFALPPLSTSRGMPTQAVYGFIRMLFKLIKEEHPTRIAVVFDSPKRTFREDLFEDYKANRPPAPSDLSVQIPYIHRAVEAFRIKSLVREGYEADDVIGTLAARAARERFQTVIITADKDFMQIVGPHTTLWDTMRDRRVSVREVRERFGVEPGALIEIQALMGDPIDNVKGVPGVGEKTATALIREFGDVETLYRSLDGLAKGKIRGAKRLAALLAEHRADVELARKLVSIKTDVPLDVTPEELTWPGIDEAAVAALLRELEFTSLLEELAPSQAALPLVTSQEVTLTGESVAQAAAHLKASKRLALHLVEDETGARLKIRGDDKIYVAQGSLIGELGGILGEPSPPKACHDLKTHIRRLSRYGIALAGVDFDTMLAGFLINPGRPEPSLADLYHDHLAGLRPGGSTGSEPEIVAALNEALAPKLAADGLGRLFREIEMPVAELLAEMEATGVKVDRDALNAISREFGEEAARLERECYELAGLEFNLNSPAQLRDVLFNRLKLTARGLKRTKSGYSTDADTLEKLAAAHPMPRKLLEYRTLTKLKSTYADALASLLDPTTGRIHTTFHQALTATGRLSSSDPNLQNIPTRSPEGQRIRRAFVAEPGRLLLSADYSQIDLRVLAHLSGDPTLTSAFRKGEDIHIRTATELLGVPPEKVDATARRLAKTINFGIIYGMGPQRLATALGISTSEAADYIKRYFDRLEGVRSFIDETLAKARETGFVTTMYGRRRYLPELHAPEGGARAQAERIAVNTPIQGTSADLIKVAMVRLGAQLRSRAHEARMVMQVHDELLLEVQSENLGETREVARREMEQAAELTVPLKVDLKWGRNWAELGAASEQSD
jgi:DNA polymerase-1